MTQRCPRCGHDVELRKGGDRLKAHHVPGLGPCKDKGRCPFCHEVVYQDAVGIVEGHKVWNPAQGKLVRCPGVGREALPLLKVVRA